MQTTATAKQAALIVHLVIEVGHKANPATLPHAPTPEQLAALPGNRESRPGDLPADVAARDGKARIRQWAETLTVAQASEVIDALKANQ